MNDNPTRCLVILAGGQSRRMGQDKATIALGGERMIDRLIARYNTSVDRIILSSPHDFGTGLDFITDDPNAPGGPVGAIFTLATAFAGRCPDVAGFMTAPVDAPFAPIDLIKRMNARQGCAVASGPDRLHPTFARWDCNMVDTVRRSHNIEDAAPSLQWLARQCDATIVEWPDEQSFMNINTPEDLFVAEKLA
ncbi:molybdenum cofactor guanylyltransferase [Parasphingorhabdus halotolerans]|uniref:Molybdenum cofactor guanylyltransferase n=1 Tax=Parasphingorhabdus halotolerans TaxID=2725558 RepID=A0A6H2DKP7_9SPHN|nr:molybdenum cofactor guanylyltransferase [Parasphingorhabdus halotolerans]QJB69252.1 molybdenum cofactor guanylyltransferase [Parasphingorhabdus halotolerans]